MRQGVQVNKFTLKGDYFNGAFSAEAELNKADEKIEKFCPADTQTKLWECAVDYNNIEPVIESSQKGFQAWRKTSFADRIKVLEKFKEIATQRKEEIAYAIALETGKPLWESLTEASAVAAKVSVTISDSLKRIQPETIKSVLPNIDGHTIKKPIGPCLVVGPFNFPCHLANGQILAALLTGNSIIFKPSEKTIYSAQLLIECFHQAGFPCGVINLINGTAKTTQDILKHPSIKGIFFTGSHFVGKKILESVGTDVTKLVALELGGKNTTIIHKDANIEHTLCELLRSSFLSAGQRCTSTSTIVIHKDIEQEVISRFIELTKKIIIDHPTDFKTEPFMGPLIDQLALDKYNKSINLGVENGAEFLLAPTELKLKYAGHYACPTINYLKKATKDNPFTQEEIFGPNCSFTPYSDIDEAIKVANISDYGLAASIFTNDKNVYEQALMEIDAGIINLNRSTVGASSKLPFGGVKNSGNFHPAAVSMVDHTVSTVSSLETMDNSSKINDIKGLCE